MRRFQFERAAWCVELLGPSKQPNGKEVVVLRWWCPKTGEEVVGDRGSLDLATASEFKLQQRLTMAIWYQDMASRRERGS